MKTLLESINSPIDLHRLDRDSLSQLAFELRQFILASVSKTGGHLASNLGSVELTIALHYVFNAPDDKIVWDVGHQTYAHKILTGRREAMITMRQKGGLSGFPKRSESIYDSFGTAHSSTSISAVLGMALASKLKNLHSVNIAVIGDGAMSAGQAFEAMNNAGFFKKDIRMLVILNDNNMFISKGVGALNNYLKKLRNNEIPCTDPLGKSDKLHSFSNTFFNHLGFKYGGPIDGHDINLLIEAFECSKHLILKSNEPQFLHVVTRKGCGYELAENDPVRYHGVSKFHPIHGCNLAKLGPKTYSDVFGDWLCEAAREDQSVVAITPSMKEGSGLVNFSQQFPDRYFDVGIAEQHAISFAGGLAVSGLKPIVAIYSTFLQRGYDQLIHDIALQNLFVIFAIDRAGLVGEDGATHAGAFDVAFLRCIPNLTIMAPSDENELRQMFQTALKKAKGPIAIRYPRGVGLGIEAKEKSKLLPFGKGQIKRLSSKVLLDKQYFFKSNKDWFDENLKLFFEDPSVSDGDYCDSESVAIVAFGSMVLPALAAGAVMDATVINMRFIKPIDYELLIALAKTHQIIVFVEESSCCGGAGSGCLEFLVSNGYDLKFQLLGLPDEFINHGDRNQQLSDCGLDTDGIVNSIRNRFFKEDKL